MNRMRNLCFILASVFSVGVAYGQDGLAEAQELFDTKQADGYMRAGELCTEYLKSNPKSYEAAWKGARAYREYAQLAKEEEVEGWESICKKYGKLGMGLGEKAIQLDPKSVEGHFYYGLSVGIYSDGAGIVTALRENLKSKTQEGLEKAYEIDKTYQVGGPMKALGRFWFILPWPLNDKNKSLEFFREHQKAFPEDPEGQVFLAELLINKKETKEAKTLLERAAQSDRKYYADWAKRLLKDLN